MRNVENKHGWVGGRTAGALALSVAAILAAGCGSAPPPAADSAAEVRSPLAPPAEAAPAEILAVDLQGDDRGARIVVTTDGAPVWTSYRDESDHLIIELPNSLPGEQVVDVLADFGLVEAVRVRSQNGGRPVTRLQVQTRFAAEHTVVGDGSTLRVELVPVEPDEFAAAAIPQPEEAVEELPVAAAEPPAPPPAPAAPATEVRDIVVSLLEAGAEIRIVGDGEFYYSTFTLENPDRFVVDLVGVRNAVPGASFPVQTGIVKQVRVAQFKTRPDPIARVVVDLASAYEPSVLPRADGLTLGFGPGFPSAVTTLAQDVAAGLEPVGAEPAAEEPEELTSAAEILGMGSEENGVAPPPEPSAPVEPEMPALAAEEEPVPDIGAWIEDEEAAVEMVADEVPADQMDADEAAADEMAGAWEEPEPQAEELVEDLFPEEAPDEAYAWQQPAEEEAAPAPAVPMAGPKPAPAPVSAATAPAPGLEFDSQPADSGEKRYYGEPMTMTLKDADIKDVLRSFAQISGLNVVVQPGVSGTVTVELTNVPWDQALEQILKINGLDYQLEGNIMRIAPISQLREEAQEEQQIREAQALSIPLRTVIKRVSYAQADDIASLLQSGGGASLMSQRGSVVVDERTNTLIIKELPSFMNTVIAVIETLDTPEPQVMIEARIIETTKRFSRTLGIAWGLTGIADAAHGNTTGLQFPNNIDASGGVELLTGGSNGFLDIAMGNVLNTLTLDATLQAAESDGLINILSAPRITTLNNERATIQSGLQIPVQTVANNTVSVQFVNATLRLEVTPHVTAEGTVLMDINIQKREPQLAFAVVGATNAPIATKDARTRVIVRDGGTTVIGGIYKVSSDQGEDRVPGLANIPILKHLFKNKRRNEENEELLIFITPRVVRL